MALTPASISLTAFNCPHCGVLTTQTWYSVYGDQYRKDRTPFIATDDDISNFKRASSEDAGAAERRLEVVKRLVTAAPWIEALAVTRDFTIYNVFISECFNCDKIAVWIHSKLIYPSNGGAPEPNPDLSNDVRRDYDEASSIVDKSPRGAAALIRLCIQKLCKELGEKGENINDDIKSLVSKGLDARVQKALDVVRVIGNDAVHPGTIDLKDDRATALSLFRLLNLIAEKMISEPKHVDDVYSSLPTEKLASIEKRDGKK